MIKKQNHPVFLSEKIEVGRFTILPTIIEKKIAHDELLKICLFLTEAAEVDIEYSLEYSARLLVHPGRRGITGNLYHVGKWVDTYELFHLSCYRFHDDSEYELLTEKNPIMCTHDVSSVIEVLNSFHRSTLSPNFDKNLFFTTY